MEKFVIKSFCDLNILSNLAEYMRYWTRSVLMSILTLIFKFSFAEIELIQ